MISYTKEPKTYVPIEGNEPIASFVEWDSGNIDKKTVDSFGKEWEEFHNFSEKEIQAIGDDYFDIVPNQVLNKSTIVLDVGCGSGRWSKYMSDKVRFIEAVDPSDAILPAKKMLKNCSNIRITKASTDYLPFEDNSFDLVVSLGVLHHIPDTAQALKNCVAKVKKGGACLIYLYYNLDNRGPVFRLLFYVSNLIRRLISALPFGLKSLTCNLIALTVYYPLSRFSLILDQIIGSRLSQKIPLYYYRDKSLQVLRNDALDRFGTPLEQRFSKNQIHQMMKSCGLTDIKFSENAPYWHAIGIKGK